MNLFLATANRHKIEELTAILRASGVAAEVSAPSVLGGMPPVDEDGATFEANARKKALALAEKIPGSIAGISSAWAVADDSGLCVDALDGAPGVISARFAGAGASDAANTGKLLELLEQVAAPKRSAAFRCCIVAASPDGRTFAFEGRCPGRIINAPRGAGGFGYDPVFVPEGHDRTFAELPAEIKNRISHRARALEQFVAWLKQ
jgi:XTP/dITP diphosphohydrolase